MELTELAFEKNNIANKVIVTKEGVEAMRYIGLYWLVWNEPPPV